MPRPLVVHPLTPCAAEVVILVGAARPERGRLAVTYALFGPIDRIRLPPLDASVRMDALWRRTCFEAFVQAGSGDAYLELNFAPSGAWAAYHFSGHRDGMRIASDVGAPRIDVMKTAELYELRASIDLGAPPSAAAWRLGLSAVIEETSGAKSYWALGHSTDKPDFHDSRTFLLDLPRPEPS